MRKYNNVVKNVVDNNLCVGCGICEPVCPTDSLKIKLNQEGTYEPYMENNECDETGNCLKVCPFNPFPDKEVRTEDEISDKINIQEDNFNHSKAFGKYHSLHVGYASDYREEASSGGIATWLLKKMLREKIVDAVITTVEETSDNNRYFKYVIIDKPEQLDLSSKTKYYPIELSEVLRLSQKKSGNFALIGLPCSIKAIRLAQINDPSNWHHIKFTISIFCGGLKSSFFTEYLASKIGVGPNQITKPQYRVKNVNSNAGDYSFSCVKKGEQTPRVLPMKQVGDMWGTGYFKPNPCDFCEDLSGELADISLGDAWIPPYNQDGRGNSLIITRTILAKQLIADGIGDKQLLCDVISKKQAFLSQEGNYNHRRKGLSYRLKWADRDNQIVPPKRTKKVFIENPIKAKIFRLRQKIQIESTIFWGMERNKMESNFEKNISATKNKLMFYTKLDHLYRKKYWIRKLKGK
ncbi:Coenzyme F420 hydrogenase/dehydrogenase, beta subunit C-terminal domain [Arenibacter sp. F20364]|uniref:Coenzyme F420 hydrogenase/dehydrogenase, beta subunit C-terminal domain n=1 Tax=Arenibacter sp. F20364 TaxID=2926415 RepID=UPI001FF4ADD3|nr:Coenzyme F420 hydrogenase/dehydrogenase, beta subunit C-terminal domain [Arenibacter sp. F20364]MCK0191657.1 Coenzyme F420 hydrogenase/dehydrogenase, beta subunit C-terminal domain [Arenibacter sp. F20364]